MDLMGDSIYPDLDPWVLAIYAVQYVSVPVRAV